MAWDAQFLAMFSETVEIAPWDGTFNENGQPGVGSFVAYPARISGKKLALRRPFSESDNQDVFDVWFRADASVRVTVNDQVRLPDQNVFSENRTPEIYAVARVTDDDGQHHVKIQCGWQYHRQGQ